MTTTGSRRWAEAPAGPVWRLSTDQYHRMVGAGILTDMNRVELLDGWLVVKMLKNPPHRAASRLVQKALERVVPAGWDVDREAPVTLATQDSEPEPDVVVIRGEPEQYVDRHPGPADVALVVEVADASLGRDRGAKKRVYAAGGIPVYWIVNLIDSVIEVHTAPASAGETPDYRERREYRPGDTVPVVIEGVEVASLEVARLIPQSRRPGPGRRPDRRRGSR